jgi:PilZ domain
MEGPNIGRYPRTQFCCPIELRVGNKTTRLDGASGNLNIHGLFIQARSIPANTPVHIKISSVRVLEVEGVVRFCDTDGIGIEFTGLTDDHRRRIDDLIAHFLPQEVLARAKRPNAG